MKLNNFFIGATLSLVMSFVLMACDNTTSVTREGIPYFSLTLKAKNDTCGLYRAESRQVDMWIVKCSDATSTTTQYNCGKNCTRRVSVVSDTATGELTEAQRTALEEQIRAEKTKEIYSKLTPDEILFLDNPVRK